MKIIALQGLSNTGKTTTIGLVYELLLQNGGKSTNKTPLGLDPKDFCDIVLGYKNLKIAIFTIGDNSTAISKAISGYNVLECDIFICSLSTGTPKIRANNKINRFPNTRIVKTTCPPAINENQANNTDANTIFSLI